MPIIWRYLLSQYIKVMVLCVVSFVAVLMTTRLDEIAHFATLGPEGRRLIWFALYQIPYILPIALPISALISSILLIQRLSTTHELTAMRACGLSLREILTPVLLAAGFLSIGSFYVISEMATSSHLETSLIKNELRSINPLLLLHNKHLMKMKGIFFDTMGASKMGEMASKVIIAAPDKKANQINILVAEKLQASGLDFKGEGLTLITSLNSDIKEHYDHIMLENIGEASTTVSDFSQMLQKKVWKVNNDHLRLPLLLVKIQEQQEKYRLGLERGLPTADTKTITRGLNRSYGEIARRISAAIAVFTFTLMGAAFGVSISRQKNSRGIIIVTLLASLYLVSFFASKGTEHLLATTLLLFFAPHVFIVAASIRTLERARKGIE